MKENPLVKFPEIKQQLIDSLKAHFPRPIYTWENSTRYIDANEGAQSVIQLLEKAKAYQEKPKQ